MSWRCIWKKEWKKVLGLRGVLILIYGFGDQSMDDWLVYLLVFFGWFTYEWHMNLLSVHCSWEKGLGRELRINLDLDLPFTSREKWAGCIFQSQCDSILWRAMLCYAIWTVKFAEIIISSVFTHHIDEYWFLWRKNALIDLWKIRFITCLSFSLAHLLACFPWRSISKASL